jgi:hypothetical protein
MEMSNTEFQQIAQEIANNGGNLNGMAVNLKVDGAGIRFGKDSAGRPFMMTSRVTTPLYQDDVGYFTSFGQEKGQESEQLARTKKYDDALALITGSKFIQSLPSDTIVQAEMMYVPMAEKTDQGLKFVNISYDPKKLGRQMTLVPFMVKQYSTGEELPTADKIIKRLVAAGDNNIKIITNRLEQKGINVSKIIAPILELDPKGKQNTPAFDQAKQALSDAIINSPKLAGKDVLGDNMEGIVVNLPSGGLFKVTSSQMKSAMAAKMATTTDSQSFGDKQTRTAVVATGNFAGHRGHEQLIDMTIEKAKEIGGTPFVFVGRKVGKDDPIDLNTKMETLRKLYPGVDIRLVQNQIDATGKETQGSDLKKVEMELVKKAPYYNNILIAVGSDQVPSMTARTEKVTQRFSTYPPLAHVKAGVFPTPRGADEGGTGVSTTKLRDALKNLPEEEAFKVWSEAYNVQKLGVDWIKHLMDIARSNMNIQQPVPQQPAPQPGVQQPAQQPQPVAETRLFNTLVRPRLTETAKTSATVRMQKAADQQRARSNASLARTPSSIPRKEEPKKQDVAKDQLDEILPALAAGAGALARGGVAVGRMAGRALSKVPGAVEKVAIQGLELLNANVPGGIFNPDGSLKGTQILAKYLSPQQIQQVQQVQQQQKQGVAEASISTQVILPKWKIGLPVFVKHLGQKGKIASLGNDSAIVDVGMRQYRVPLDGLKRYPSQGVAEKMLPKSAFAGSNKNKLGPAAHLKGSLKRPARQGDLVGGDAEESIEREGKIKGVDGKACWKGKRYAGKVKKVTDDDIQTAKEVLVKKTKSDTQTHTHKSNSNTLTQTLSNTWRRRDYKLSLFFKMGQCIRLCEKKGINADL